MRFRAIAIVVLSTFVPSATGWAQSPDPAASTAEAAAPPSEEHGGPLERARELYRQGAEKYREGRYREALEAFAEAHALASSPVLLFNIAQSHRNLGQCAEALAAYRDYLREPDDEPDASRRRAAAGIHVANLDPVCGRPQPAPAMVPPPEKGGPASALVRDTDGTARLADARTRVPPASDERRTWKTVGWTSLVVAAVLGGTAAGLHLWNSSRFDSLRAEDQLLDTDPSLTDDEVWARSRKNNEQRESIGEVDQVTLGLTVAAAVAALTGAAAILIAPRSPDVARARVGPSWASLVISF